MPEIVQLINAEPGFNAVIVDLVSGKPEFHPIVMWGLIEEHDEQVSGSGDQETDVICDVNQGVVPLIVAPDRKGATLQPAFMFDAFIGIAAKSDGLEQWVKPAEEYLAIKAAGLLEEETPEKDRKWN